MYGFNGVLSHLGMTLVQVLIQMPPQNALASCVSYIPPEGSVESLNIPKLSSNLPIIRPTSFEGTISIDGARSLPLNPSRSNPRDSVVPLPHEPRDISLSSCLFPSSLHDESEDLHDELGSICPKPPPRPNPRGLCSLFCGDGRKLMFPKRFPRPLSVLFPASYPLRFRPLRPRGAAVLALHQLLCPLSSSHPLILTQSALDIV